MQVTGNSLDPRICDQIITEVHRQLLEIVTFNLGDNEQIMSKTKQLYNQLSKAVPDLVLTIKDMDIIEQASGEKHTVC